MSGEPRQGLVVAIMGPTAAGKTGLSVALAGALDGELVNADSRQAIAELRVGVCKPTAAELGNVRCHGLDWRRLGDHFTVANFVQLASTQMEECQSRDLVPILVGGTGLYLRALLEGFDFGGAKNSASSPPPAPVDDLEAAVVELRRLSPQRYREVDLRNPRRVGRALEMARGGLVASRRPASWQAVRLGCEVAPHILRERIRQRSEKLLGPDLRQEVEGLLGAGFPASLIATSAIGYAEALAWMAGQMTRDAAVSRLTQRTWHYARAQMTWLRKEPDLVWIDASADRGEMLEASLAIIGRRLRKEAN